jgi:PKD domain
MRPLTLVSLLAVALTACGGSHPPTSPSSAPTTPSTGSGSAPTAAITLKADAAGSRDAVASLSEVIVDASASTGTGLTYAIDFGDGASATTATAKHVYATPATYTVTATVTDAQGRKAGDTRQITVRDATGSWFQAGYVQKTTRVEVRRLTIDAQDGTTVRGTYRVTGDTDRAFTGTLTPPRDIRITADAGVSLEGTLPGRVSDDAELWTLIAHGDSADGQRLDFRAITSAPGVPPPDADMKISFGGDPAAWAPIAAVTPVLIDGAASRGAGLAYFIEFGDGFVATTPQAAHVLDTSFSVPLTARVTVVDRFGRSDQESFAYRDFDLAVGTNTAERDYWVQSGQNESLLVEFMSRAGRNYVGRAQLPSVASTPALATLSEGPRIRIVLPELGLTYEGSLTMSAGFNATLAVVQHGGGLDGKAWNLRRTSYF